MGNEKDYRKKSFMISDIKYSSDDQIRKETSRACGTRGREVMHTEFLVGRPEGKRPLGGPGRRQEVNIKIKHKAVPLQAWSGPEGSRKLRFPDFVTIAQDGGKVVSFTHQPPLTSRKYSWYSFLLEAESTPGPQCDRKDFISMKNSNDTVWNRTSDLPICSTAP